MPAVTFHFNCPDRVVHAARLVRKAHRQAMRVTVLGQATDLDKLDRLLWTADPLDFVAHLLVRPGSAPAASLAETPIWLVERLADAPAWRTLIHLGDEMPEDVQRFDRIAEIVPASEPGRSAGRQRWRHYREAGLAIEAFDAGASGEG